MTCCNCSAEAVYYVADPGANPLAYCRAHIPRHLSVRAQAGQFPLPPAPELEPPAPEAP